jgi:plasmid maintenance system antidote protein VapI
MAATSRGIRFNSLIGDELKLEFQRRGKSAAWVASEIGIARQQLNLYTTGQRAIPVAIIVDSCEAIGATPEVIALRAYNRLLEELGNP